MAKGTIDFTQSASSGRYIDGKIEWSATASASSNTSALIVKLYVKKGSTTETLTIPTEGNWTYAITVDGTSVGGMTNKPVLEEWVLLYTHTTSISHKVDGSKSITISGSITAPAGTNFANHKTSGSKTVALDSILGATTIDSVTSPNHRLDDTITVLYTPKNSICYNQRIVYLNINGTLTEIHTENLGQRPASQQTHTLKFDADKLSTIYEKISNTATAKIRVTFRTYSDSSYRTQIGSDQSREIDLSLPTSTDPTAVLTVLPVNTNSWLAGKNIYVAGLSGATVALSATPGEGAQLTSTNIIYNGTTYNAIALNVTTLKNPGNISFDAKVINTRGRSATDSKNITVLPYSPPLITSVAVERGTYNGGWTADDDGPDARIIFKTDLELINEGNTYTVTFKLDGKASTPSHGTTASLTSKTECEVYFLGFNSEKSYNLQITATDKAGGTGTAVITIPTASVTIEYRANGKGIAFGKTSEKDAFECAWDAEFKGDMSIAGNVSIDGNVMSIGGQNFGDFVVEQGKSGIWIYRKWNSGIAECWGKLPVSNLTIKTGNGSMYRSAGAVYSPTDFPYPFAFATSPCVSANFIPTGDDGAWVWWVNGGTKTTVLPDCYLFRPSVMETPGVTGYMDIAVSGRWK